ncbi:DUF1692-domain-containing protein [Coniophora puteana RWD-64-598 SS2]|uniref:DUF1692-domain-containing protein n=1 Tax=Coniophora puteana (strain RWD-64-598) TaxID=741705 RepID=A0A5M3MWN8_CONPW|nr:DUF1692-domain-containing protein [Coniophora puteana RWD-64-598 SS2]EIW83563.1 DUF1692-domain-containing protein [Coniophora puteana RWD-64-598 SS2]
MAQHTNGDSILSKLDAAVPLAKFDAFPKLPSSYKSRSESRGFLTIFVGFLCFLLILNDLSEYIWGWPDYEFGVDKQSKSFMDVNVDMVVNMPCQFLSVDLRDVSGDRLYLSKGFRRDGTLFDIGQATSLKEHAKMLSAQQAVSQSRKSRGFFSWFKRSKAEFRPTYNHQPDGSACRIYGTLAVKKVTANLHVTTLGHGYTSHMHVDHTKMNLSHVITEFSFGPYFPDISQPLDYSFEVAKDPYTAFQYYMHVVPTNYIAPRSKPLETNQYSVTHYTHIYKTPHEGIPGIFFKFDLDPMVLSIHQRTTSLTALIIRCVGVIGGVFTCATYFVRASMRAVDVVTGADQAQGLVAAESTGVRRKWAGGHLRARSGMGSQTLSQRVVRQGTGWVVEGQGNSPYASYAGTPVAGVGSGYPASPYSPYLAPGTPAGPPPGTPGGQSNVGLGFGPPPRSAHGTNGSFSSLAPPTPGSRPPSMLRPSSTGSASSGPSSPVPPPSAGWVPGKKDD